MELVSVAKELHEIGREMSREATRLVDRGRKKAETERDYRMALRKAIFKLRTEGIPVTIIGDLARGECADLKFERDLAETQFTAARDLVSSLQAQLSAGQTIIKYHSEV